MASVIDKSLLSTELEEEEENEEEFRRLLLQASQKIQSSVPSPANSRPIRPLPGFCLKTHTAAGEKVFVNVCRSSHIPPPPDLTNEELACLIESENASTFRIPMSLGEPHAEVDKSGNGCTAYDVTINTSFFNKMENNQFLKEFFVTIALEGLSEKYKMDVSNQEWRILRNRKFMGSISEQTIRTKSKPIIQEMESRCAFRKRGVGGNLFNLNPVKAGPAGLCSAPAGLLFGSYLRFSHLFCSSAIVPEFTIIAEPSLSHPERLLAKICLPKMVSARSLELDLGEDRIVLQGQPNLYHLDIFVPYSIIPEESKAQFHRATKIIVIFSQEMEPILTVLMPIQHPLQLP
ncbi:PIH1 domain-containing protein 1 [Varanus komodoensis]|nr:PIH1 domain-containing protein 1 [Varanus komodoensis]